MGKVERESSTLIKPTCKRRVWKLMGENLEKWNHVHTFLNAALRDYTKPFFIRRKTKVQVRKHLPNSLQGDHGKTWSLKLCDPGQVSISFGATVSSWVKMRIVRIKTEMMYLKF